jgi:hypothetical protein
VLLQERIRVEDLGQKWRDEAIVVGGGAIR